MIGRQKRRRSVVGRWEKWWAVTGHYKQWRLLTDGQEPWWSVISHYETRWSRFKLFVSPFHMLTMSEEDGYSPIIDGWSTTRLGKSYRQCRCWEDTSNTTLTWPSYSTADQCVRAYYIYCYVEHGSSGGNANSSIVPVYHVCQNMLVGNVKAQSWIVVLRSKHHFLTPPAGVSQNGLPWTRVRGSVLR